ncbi:uncharacterized protein B0H18DRAFT_1008608 [Fomitopsis serialis]|uniref:uncharacterized protein n=1 Tax=Fomitopsis serialis TaxID=139415 RepID=UPI00200791B1|nr:uncharacterized protein B0H18DRAFT_1008608 [Neoantrodia serialis]KAH9925831.1 hypothetical protein B0H18DRAFT_1008608 [Neoantrodia serialis]
MSRHFCCCIPVRAGVFLFSLLSFLSAGFLAAIAWFGVHLILTKADGYTNVPKRTEIILIVVGSIFTLMALTSFFGFIGSITRNRRFVKSYSFMSIFLFIGSLVSAALFLYTLYSEKNITTSCIVNENGAVKIDDCDTHVSTAGKIVATVIVAVEILVHLYIVVVIRRYVEQLEDESDFWQGPYKLTSTDVNQGLMQSKAPYPYSDAAHSYGQA